MAEPEKTTPEETPEETLEETPAQPFKAFGTEEEYRTHLEHVTKERIEREKRKATEATEKAEREAREKALKDQEDWKQLAEERTGTIAEKDKRIEELQGVEGERDTANERVTTLEKRLSGLIKPQLELVPELYRPFVAGMAVEEQAEWLEKNAEKLGTQNGPGRPAGSRPTGRPADVPRGESDKEAREGQRRARVSTI